MSKLVLCYFIISLMDDLLIHKTTFTPEVDFKTNGFLKVQGRSLPESPTRFYTQIFKWLDNFKAETVDLTVKLEYVNTSSSKIVLELIKKIDQNPNIQQFNLNWYYEIDDIDMLEFGEVVERNMKRAKTLFIELDDIDDED